MDDIVDVALVGYGPVGQTLAALLGRQGHTVEVFERQPSLYHEARAGHIDHEVMRLLQLIGVAESIEPDFVPIPGFSLLDAERNKMMSVNSEKTSLSGWCQDYNVYQPVLEKALDSAVRSLPSVAVHQGWEGIAVEQFDDHVQLTARPSGSTDPAEQRVVRARYLIGTDGANSSVRSLIGKRWQQDFGFSGPWLVCDFEHVDADVDLGWSMANQVLDPARPISAARWIGRRHSRLEFMLLPGEKPEELEDENRVWDLAKPMGITPETSRIARHAVYTFKSLMVTDWRDRRVFLTGDSAHIMPPFMGAGLCSGMRDALNLSWKLDLVLRDVCPDTLLDTYTEERRPSVEVITLMSVGMGQMITITDPEMAQARNEGLRRGGGGPIPALPGLLGGVLDIEKDGTLPPHVGTLGLQARVRVGSKIGLFDDLCGNGWRVLYRRQGALDSLSAAHRATLASIGATTHHVTPAPVLDAVVDLDFEYDLWFDSLGAEVVIVRPDFYVYAVLADHNALPSVVEQLGGQLGVVASLSTVG